MLDADNREENLACDCLHRVPTDLHGLKRLRHAPELLRRKLQCSLMLHSQMDVLDKHGLRSAEVSALTLISSQPGIQAASDLSDAALDYGRAALSENTMRAYRGDWQNFAEWCAARRSG